MNKKIYLAITIIAICLSGCSHKKNDSHDHEHEATNEAEGHDHEHGDDVIILSPEKAKASGVESAIIEKGKFQNVIKAGGQILPVQNKEAVVVANSSGVVQLPENLLEGLAVNNKQSLLAISSKNIQDGDPVLKAKITYEIAKSEYDRISPLVEQNIVSQKDFVNVQQAYKNAKVAYDALAKEYSANGLIIRSNQKGFIKEVLVQNGEFVNVGQPLVRIVDNNSLLLKANVPARYFNELNKINSANFRSINLDGLYKLADLEGKVLDYAKNLNENNTLLPVTFQFKNNGSCVAGAYADVYLLSSEMDGIISLPYSAITEEEGLYFAYKQICTEEYEKVEIKLGLDNGEAYEIKSGITPGELIVIKGAQQVRLAAASDAIPAHSHEH